MANGTSCLALCPRVLIPYLLSEGGNVRHDLATLLRILGSRLVGYAVVGMLAILRKRRSASGGCVAAEAQT